MVIKNFQLENGPGGCPSWGIFKGINRREILGWESAMPIGDSGKCTAANKDWLSTSVPFLGCCSQNSIICQVFAKQKQKQNRWLLCTKTDWTKKGELRPGVCVLTPAAAGAVTEPATLSLDFCLSLSKWQVLSVVYLWLLLRSALMSPEEEFGKKPGPFTHITKSTAAAPSSFGNCERTVHGSIPVRTP